MKYFLLFLPLLFVSCSTSQFTMYKPVNEEQGWKIEVKKTGNTFSVNIDGVSVVEKSYGFLGSQFEAAGTHKGKQVQMYGYRTFSTGYNGQTITHDQIRVIIDGTEASKFDFNS